MKVKVWKAWKIHVPDTMLISLPTTLQPSPAIILAFTIAGVLTVLLLIRCVILASVLTEQGASDSLEGCHNRDMLFGFAIHGHLDWVARRGRMENNHILDQIIRIGLYDWSGLDRQGGGKQPPIQIRYAAVMGMQLWKRINVLSDWVSVRNMDFSRFSNL